MITEQNTLNQTRAENIVSHLINNANGLLYGSVTVCVKFHDGRLASVSYSKTENTREQDLENINK